MTVSAIKVRVIRKPLIRMKVLPRYPSDIVGGTAVSVTKSGGNITVGLDVDAAKEVLDFDPTQYATAAQGDKADTAVQPARAVNTGTGLTGGGDLSADRTIALDAASIASLALADTATQPGDLGTAAAADTTDFATAAQGTKADSALQSGDIGSTVQAHDAFLDSIAGLGTAADKMLYTTAANTAAETGITSAGRSMVGAASAAAQTALLSAVVGDSGSGGTKGLVPAPAAGDAAASKFLKADGTWAAFNFREVLTADRTYYVRTDGSDSNDGLTDSSGGAFLTIDRARQAATILDLNNYGVTIQVGDGTYTAGAAFTGQPVGANNAYLFAITIQGNSTTPGNVIVSVTSANCFSAQNGAKIYVKDMELRTTTSGDCLAASANGEIYYTNIRFGACAAMHKEAVEHSRIKNIGDYAIVGGAVAHEHCPNLGYILNLSATVTIIGTPAFSSFYVGAALGGMVQYVAVTFSGSATGQRYLAHKNSVIDSNGGGSTYFPGSIAGATDTGGQYI